MFVVTREWMHKYRSPGGGFYAVQLKQLGESYPLKAGWLQRCVGKEITEAQRMIFERGAEGKRTARNLALKVKKQVANRLTFDDFIKQSRKVLDEATTLEKHIENYKKALNRNEVKFVVEEPVKTKKPRRKHKPLYVNPIVATNEFLQTYEWRKLRMQALKKYGPRCMCCGATPQTGAVMNVDHIKPRKIFPELALEIDNLQVLCNECNHGKGNWDMTDWREKEINNG
jgi:5-methylcytosine-specific restriction endonuclease McrA